MRNPPITFALVSVVAAVGTGAAAPPPTPPRLVAEPARAVRDPMGGGSRAFEIASAILGESRRVFVHLPASFEKSSASRRYPTMIAFDGEFLLQPLVAVSEVLTRQGQIPESVIVAVDNVDDYQGRVHDLTPPGLSVSGSSLDEGGDRFLDFIEKELLPALDAQFRAAAPRTLVGTSSGGILVTYAAATRAAFRCHLALDAPTHLGDNWLPRKLLARAAVAGAPVHYASIEVRFGWSDEEWNRLVATAPPSWLVHRERLVHESHTSMQFLGAYLGLRELFRDYSMQAAPQAPTMSTLPWYEKLAANFGAPMVPPEALLRQVIDDLLMEGRGGAARAAFETLHASYGEPAGARELRERITDVERRPPPTETVEGLLATPFPTVEEARDYLGEWEGEQWINPVAKSRFALRLVAEGGKVVGSLVYWPAPRTELVERLQYLVVTPQGLTFGNLNGMRPRGVLLHEGRRSGEVLRGEVRFGGIAFTLPGGEQPPKQEFELRRRVSRGGAQ